MHVGVICKLLFRRVGMWKAASMPTDATRLALLVDCRALHERIARLGPAAKAHDAVFVVLGHESPKQLLAIGRQQLIARPDGLSRQSFDERDLGGHQHLVTALGQHAVNMTVAHGFQRAVVCHSNQTTRQRFERLSTRADKPSYSSAVATRMRSEASSRN